jgi:endonuclease/exonuclease/phosphatase (EEP) superfamily protein YafD
MTVTQHRLRRLAGIARWLLPPCSFALLLPLFNRLLPPSSHTLAWGLDLAAHWQWLYAALWLVLCLLCATRTWQWLLAVPLALLPWFTASAPMPQADDGAPTLIIAAANVHAGNHDPSPLIAWLRTQPADLIVLSELTPEYATALQSQLHDDYPYRALYPQQSPFGIGIVSRLPLDDIRPSIDSDGVQVLSARTRFEERPLRIIAAHPMPPLAPEWHDKRDALLRLIAKDADASNTPVVLAGDLNATPWSSALIGVQRFGLRRATGLLPTWPSRNIGIPIDHILASRHWRGSEYTRGPDIGSDHVPVRAALSWADAGTGN